MKNSLAKSAVFNIIYQGLNVIFPLISASYVAKVLAPSGVGQVSYTQNIVSYFVMIAALGMPTYGTREISKYRDNQSRLNKTFSELFVLNGLSTAVCMGVYGIFTALFVKDNHLLYIVCGLELVFNFINVDWFFRGKEDFVYIAVRSAVVKVLSLIMLVLFVRDEGDCAAYALLVCLANGCNYFFNITRLHKEVRLTFRNLQLKQHMRPLLFLLICSVAASLYSKIDITMLGNMCSDASVGFYSTAFKTVGIALAVIASATSVFLPRISYCYDTDREKFREYVELGVKIVTFIAVPAMIGIALVSGEVVTVLFGDEFSAAGSVVAILSPLLVIKGIGDIMCYQVLVSVGKENYFLGSYIMAAIANIVLNSLLIPMLDYNGAAIASVASELIVNATLLRYSLHVVRPRLGRRYIASVGVGTISMTVAVLLVQHLVNNLLIRMLVCVFVGVMAYITVNFLMKNDVIAMLMCKLRAIIKKNQG